MDIIANAKQIIDMLADALPIVGVIWKLIKQMMAEKPQIAGAVTKGLEEITADMTSENKKPDIARLQAFREVAQAAGPLAVIEYLYFATRAVGLVALYWLALKYIFAPRQARGK